MQFPSPGYGQLTPGCTPAVSFDAATCCHSHHWACHQRRVSAVVSAHIRCQKATDAITGWGYLGKRTCWGLSKCLWPNYSPSVPLRVTDRYLEYCFHLIPSPKLVEMQRKIEYRFALLSCSICRRLYTRLPRTASSNHVTGRNCWYVHVVTVDEGTLVKQQQATVTRWTLGTWEHPAATRMKSLKLARTCKLPHLGHTSVDIFQMGLEHHIFTTYYSCGQLQIRIGQITSYRWFVCKLQCFNGYAVIRRSARWSKQTLPEMFFTELRKRYVPQRSLSRTICRG